MVKEFLRELLLKIGLYHKINDFRFRHDTRTPSQRKFYARFIGQDNLVFDVGANIGQRSKIFSELSRKVIAIEPQPNCVKHLRSRFMFNPRVTIETVALGDKEDESLMWQSSSHDISSMSRRFIETMGQGVFRNQSWNKEIRVPTKTLDQLIVIHGLPAFLKIDVEGYELNVLQGLTQRVPFISFEYAPELIDEARKCVERINRISSAYHYNYCLGENLDFVLREHVSYSTFMNETLARMARQDTFGDVYAILEKSEHSGDEMN